MTSSPEARREAESASTVGGPGKAIAHFRVGLFQLGCAITLAMSGLVGAVGVVLAVFSVFEGPWTLPLVLAFLAAAGGLKVLHGTLRDYGLQVIVGEGGLLIQRLDGRRLILWRDVVAIEQIAVRTGNKGIFQPRPHLFLILASGERFLVDKNLPGDHLLPGLIEERTLAHLAPPLIGRLEAGEEVNIGDVHVGPKGIRLTSEGLLWEGVDSVRREAGAIVVRRKGTDFPFYRLSVEGYPNYHLLPALIEWGLRKLQTCSTQERPS